MDDFMNYKEVRIEQIKDSECIDRRTIWINEEITDITEFMVLRMFDKITEIDRSKNILPENAEPILLKISSCGGDVYSTLSIVSKIESLKKQGYKIYGYAYGKAMSGAFKIFISCSKRHAQSNTELMCHMPNHYEFEAYRSMEDDRRRYEAIKRLWVRCRNIILEYTKIPEEILDNAVDKNDDLYFWADESIENKLGIVDELI